VKTMLLDGEIYVMPMPSPPHNFTMIWTERVLCSAFNDETRTHIRNQMGFDIGARNDPGPDLAVIAGLPEEFVTGNPTAATMIVEVVVTSLTMDMTTKAELYALTTVPEY
jgi:Uma2 family endonuclease